MRAEPTLVEKIEALPSLEEIEGAEGQIKQDRRMTPDVSAAIARRRAELMRRNIKK